MFHLYPPAGVPGFKAVEVDGRVPELQAEGDVGAPQLYRCFWSVRKYTEKFFEKKKSYGYPQPKVGNFQVWVACGFLEWKAKNHRGGGAYV